MVVLPILIPSRQIPLDKTALDSSHFQSGPLSTGKGALLRQLSRKPNIADLGHNAVPLVSAGSTKHRQRRQQLVVDWDRNTASTADRATLGSWMWSSNVPWRESWAETKDLVDSIRIINLNHQTKASSTDGILGDRSHLCSRRREAAHINSDSFDLPMITLTDFPNADPSAAIFTHWIRLWNLATPMTCDPVRKAHGLRKAAISQQLIDWVRSLPTHLQLPPGEPGQLNFDRNMYYLHAGYLTLVMLLHFTITKRMFDIGIERILKAQGTARSGFSSAIDSAPCRSLVGTPGEGHATDTTQWMNYFPHITAETSPLIGTLILNDAVTMPFSEMNWSNEAQIQSQDLFRDIGTDGWSAEDCSEWFGV